MTWVFPKRRAYYRVHADKLWRGNWFSLKDVEGGSKYLAASESVDQSCFVDAASSGRVDDADSLLHFGKGLARATKNMSYRASMRLRMSTLGPVHGRRAGYSLRR